LAASITFIKFHLQVKPIKTYLNLSVSALILSAGISTAYGTTVNGVEAEGNVVPAYNDGSTPQLIAPAAGSTIINFDEDLEPCQFLSTTALRDKYMTMGVVFDGPAINDGGAILDECSNFSVIGHSSPNFLAFNTAAGLSDGGIPQGPETLLFDPPVDQVQANVGSGNAGTIELTCYDSTNNLVDSDNILSTDALQTIAVSGSDITQCEFSFTGAWMVLDDLAFREDEGSCTPGVGVYDSNTHTVTGLVIDASAIGRGCIVVDVLKRNKVLFEIINTQPQP